MGKLLCFDLSKECLDSLEVIRKWLSFYSARLVAFNSLVNVCLHLSEKKEWALTEKYALLNSASPAWMVVYLQPEKSITESYRAIYIADKLIFQLYI